MSKGARLAIGLATAGVLLVVSLVSVIVGAVLATDGATFFPADQGIYAGYDFSGRADAEILDVDQEGPWTWVDVRFDTGHEVVVTGLDWPSDDAPGVGDTVALAYDPSDPEYGVVPRRGPRCLDRRARRLGPLGGRSQGSVAGLGGGGVLGGGSGRRPCAHGRRPDRRLVVPRAVPTAGRARGVAPAPAPALPATGTGPHRLGGPVRLSVAPTAAPARIGP